MVHECMLLGDSNIYVYDAFDNFKLVNTLRCTVVLSPLSTYLMTVDICCRPVKMARLSWDLSSETPTTLDPKTWQATSWIVRSGARNYNSTGLYPAYADAKVVLALTQART